MERKLLLNRRPFYAAFFLCLIFFVSNLNARQLRFQLWAHLEELPSADKTAVLPENPYAVAITSLKKVAPFILEGMIYGWNFSYTPSDNLRGVKEFFDFEARGKIEENDSSLVFESPYREDGRLYCWVSYTLSPEQERLVSSWQSVLYPKIKGSGSASLFDGYEGLYAAYADAVRESVRSYARGLVKNKPKEINGSVILEGMPRQRVVSGRYITDITLFLSLKEIIPYSVY